MPARISSGCARRGGPSEPDRPGLALRHSLTHILPYRPEQMFDLVGDVETYPQFVPWVTALRTWNAHTAADGAEVLDAEAQVGFAFLREKFATRVRCDASARTVSVDLLYGPFRRLQNVWRFSPHPAGTQVDFLIDFEFKSRLLDGLLAVNMQRAVERLVNCFEARAATLYGQDAVSASSPPGLPAGDPTGR
jgi:coenzyme Q-binding protein COQ10